MPRHPMQSQENYEAAKRVYHKGDKVYWTTGQTNAVVVQVHSGGEYSIIPEGARTSMPTRTRAVFLRPR